MRVEAALKAQSLLGPVLESPLLGYKGVQGGFEDLWSMRLACGVGNCTCLAGRTSRSTPRMPVRAYLSAFLTVSLPIYKYSPA